MSARAATLVGALALLAPAACGPSGPQAPPPYELRSVVAERIAALEAVLASDDEPPVPEATPDELAEEVDGLVVMRANASGRMRDVPLEDIRAVGLAAVPRLVRTLEDAERAGAERRAAAEFLAALDTPSATRPLVDAAVEAPEGWLRAVCAWAIGRTSDDRFLPRLVLPLKYETDYDTVVWLASTLAAFGNYAGLDGLSTVAASAEPESARVEAVALLAELATKAGVEDGAALAERWRSPRAGSLPGAERPPSPRLELALWRTVERLSSEHFQLRGVDDARFVLSRQPPWGAELVAQALHDTDVYVRLHAAQVLERMGGRARGVGPALVDALREPRIAPAAAEALGSVGYEPAETPLREALAGAADHELRVAAARGLGRLGAPAAVAALRAVFDTGDEPRDLRRVAAGALVELGEGDHVAAFLLEELAGEDDPAGAELALGAWLAHGHDAERPGFAPVWEAWTASASPGAVPTAEQARARRAARRAVVAPLVAERAP